ncbi:hypothetical protein EOL96_00265 [Candidatus Saccharibacteria bacterium]|nr:hypothetical protein [Candidatus Saccharibacteria bacterium]
MHNYYYRSFVSGEQVKMTRRQDTFRVGGGIGTLAKAEYERQQAADAKLAEQRKPQAEKAKGYVRYHGKGITPWSVETLPEGDFKRVIFEGTISAFEVARPVKDRTGTTTKGAIRVAAETAADKHSEFFKDPDTAAEALLASEWAAKALKWAGDQLYREKAEAPATT